MSDYKFTLPYPPSVNGYWRTFRNRQIISKRGREYKKDVKAAMVLLNLDNELVSDSIEFHMVINPPTLRKYDVDNFTKGVFDALSECKFWVDDEQVVKLTVVKGVKTKGGNVEVKINRTRV